MDPVSDEGTEMFECIRADIRRLTESERSTREQLGVLLFHLGLHAVLLYRLSRWFHLHHLRPLAVLTSYINAVLTGAQISSRARIGKGLVIYHPQGIVIGATAVMGNHCTLVHGNVIGQLYGDNDRPIIGDYFYAGAGAKLLGQIEIGDHVRVGPNTVVIKSLPSGVTVAAPPARIIFREEVRPRATDNGAVSRETILRRLLPLLMGIVDGATPIESIRESTGLLGAGMGFDSVGVLNLLGAIEEEFSLTVDESEVNVSHFETVGSLVTFIEGKVSS